MQTERTVSDAFDQNASGASLMKMMDLDLIIGSGGVLSHAPRRTQSFMMMIDAFMPEGVTELAVDSIFMMPHLGVLSTVNEKAATDVFEKDCLIRLGTVVAPVVRKGRVRDGDKLAHLSWTGPGGAAGECDILVGEVRRFELPYDPGEKTRITVTPERKVDVGAGMGQPLEREINGGVVGLVTDGRGRPLVVPTEQRTARLEAWNAPLEVYPE